MIGIFTNTSNVYRPQWHPDQPLLARPGLLSTASPVPTRRPESSLAPWFDSSWRMGEPWLSLKRSLRTVPGAVGLPVPVPRPPIAMKPCIQPDWTMDAPWLWEKLPDQTPASVVTITPPPVRTPDSNWSATLFPAWTMQTPWLQRPPSPFTPDASVAPLRPMERPQWFQRTPDWQADAPWLWDQYPLLTPPGAVGLPVPPPQAPISMKPWLQPDWTMDAPWQWEKLTLQTPPSVVAVLPPPTRPPDSNWLATFFPAWALLSPWTMPTVKLVLDASLPPTCPPSINLVKLFQPDWTMDAPWQWEKLSDQIPASAVVIAPPPTRQPDGNLSTVFRQNWTLDAPWINVNRALQAVPGTAGLPVPPPASPISMTRWLQPDWTMDAAWQWQKMVYQLPPAPLVVIPLVPELILPASMRVYRIDALVRPYVLKAKK